MDLNGLIDAIGFLGHVIPREFIGARPAAAADLPELTSSAFSPIAIGIAEISEDFRIHPDLLERLFFYISAIQFKVAAGLNLADMGDEAERDAPQTSSGHGIQSVGLWGDLSPLFFRLLP
jgi:hypothetical protein